MKNTVIKYGLIGAAIIIVLSGIMWSTSGDNYNFDYGQLIGYATMIVALSTIFFGLRAYRRDQGGHLSFGQGFKIGLLITLIASVGYIGTWMVVSSGGKGQEMLEAYKEHSVEKMKAAGKDQTYIDEKVAGLEKMAEAYKNPLVKIGFGLLEILPVGLIISLISALILKRKPEGAMTY